MHTHYENKRHVNGMQATQAQVLIIFCSFLCHDSAPMWVTANQWNEESMLKQSNNALLTIIEGAMTYPWRNVPVNDSFSKRILQGNFGKKTQNKISLGVDMFVPGRVSPNEDLPLSKDRSPNLRSISFPAAGTGY